MIQNGKKLAGLVLAMAITAGALAGCSGKGESSQVSSSSAVSSSAPVSSQASSAPSQASSAAGANTTKYDYSAGLTEDGYFEGITAADYVTLPDYKNMEIPEDVSTISDEDLQSELDSRMTSFASTQQIKDRAVEDGDTVNIDYVGSVDGVEFAGGNTGGAGTTVTIGVTSYIDDFLEQLIGHMPGDTFDVNVTFPDPYPSNTDLSGKDAVFVTTINYIQSETVPELTDEFVAANWKETEGWSNVEEAKKGVKEEMRQAAIANYMWQELQTQAEVSEVPETVAQYHLENMKNYYVLMADQYGLEIDDFLSQYVGVEDMDALVEKNESQLEENAKSSLILQTLCEEMGLKPGDEDIADFFRTNASVADYSSLEAEYGRPYLCLLTRENMVKLKLAEGK